jgi:hypothetical protein
VKTIVWDVDDVLNNLMRAWLETAWLPAHPTCQIHYRLLTKNPPHHLLGATKNEYLQSLDDFRLNHFTQLKPIAEILTWFETCGQKFRHIALTATPLKTAALSAEWTMRHFGQWIRTFAFVPSPRPDDPGPVYDQSKADYLGWWGQADILIDDNPAHISAAQTLGLTALLVAQPWNQGGLTMTAALNFLNEGDW